MKRQSVLLLISSFLIPLCSLCIFVQGEELKEMNVRVKTAYAAAVNCYEDGDCLSCHDSQPMFPEYSEEERSTCNFLHPCSACHESGGIPYTPCLGGAGEARFTRIDDKLVMVTSGGQAHLADPYLCDHPMFKCKNMRDNIRIWEANYHLGVKGLNKLFTPIKLISPCTCTDIPCGCDIPPGNDWYNSRDLYCYTTGNIYYNEDIPNPDKYYMVSTKCVPDPDVGNDCNDNMRQLIQWIMTSTSPTYDGYWAPMLNIEPIDDPFNGINIVNTFLVPDHTRSDPDPNDQYDDHVFYRGFCRAIRGEDNYRWGDEVIEIRVDMSQKYESHKLTPLSEPQLIEFKSDGVWRPALGGVLDLSNTINDCTNRDDGIPQPDIIIGPSCSTHEYGNVRFRPSSICKVEDHYQLWGTAVYDKNSPHDNKCAICESLYPCTPPDPGCHGLKCSYLGYFKIASDWSLGDLFRITETDRSDHCVPACGFDLRNNPSLVYYYDSIQRGYRRFLYSSEFEEDTIMPPDCSRGSRKVVLSELFTPNSISIQDIYNDPKSQLVTIGMDAHFSVQSNLDGTTTYQWLKGGTLLSDVGPYSGTTTPRLSVVVIGSPIGSPAVGEYSCKITNEAGMITSETAELKLVNLLPATIIDTFQYGYGNKKEEYPLDGTKAKWGMLYSVTWEATSALGCWLGTVTNCAIRTTNHVAGLPFTPFPNQPISSVRADIDVSGDVGWIGVGFSDSGTDRYDNNDDVHSQIWMNLHANGTWNLKIHGNNTIATGSINSPDYTFYESEFNRVELCYNSSNKLVSLYINRESHPEAIVQADLSSYTLNIQYAGFQIHDSDQNRRPKEKRIDNFTIISSQI